MSKEASHVHRLRHEQVNIGPGSLIWQYYGDVRTNLTGMSAAILQVMYPSVGAGVAEHSDFFEDPWNRIDRSQPKIMGVLYDPDGRATGEEVKRYHTEVKGIDDNGRKYHALEPETYYWTHATFQQSSEDVIDRLDPRVLTIRDREQFQQESNTLYARYGVSMRPVPPDYIGFRDKWNYVTQNVLEMTPTAEKVIDKVLTGNVDRRKEIPAIVWNPAMAIAGNELIRILSIGGLPENVRERFDIPWSRLDQAKLNLIDLGIRSTWQKVWPDNLPDLRYHPRAREGILYERQRAANAA
jgi:uncharacterized protein (DUF2236 family)